MLETVGIVTTAALPWLTGTATNPLSRADALARRGLDVTLYLPWISPTAQARLFGDGDVARTPGEQEAMSRAYLEPHGGPGPKIRFYPAWSSRRLGSIFPARSLARRISPCDWLLLEEPEHLHWLSPLAGTRRRAGRVTGIVLTNYDFYLRGILPAGLFPEHAFRGFNRWLFERHCDDVIRLSASLPESARSRVLNVNGVHPDFFRTPSREPQSRFAYFMGKLLWAKGFRELIDLVADCDGPAVDVFGDGPDRDAIVERARAGGVNLHLRGISTRPAVDLGPYKVFVNPSRSEGWCTTTGEALAMGKFAIVPRHPSNEFFYPFENCLVYETPAEFQDCLRFASEHEPRPDDPHLRMLEWEAATERLLAVWSDARGPSSMPPAAADRGRRRMGP